MGRSGRLVQLVQVEIAPASGRVDALDVRQRLRHGAGREHRLGGERSTEVASNDDANGLIDEREIGFAATQGTRRSSIAIDGKVSSGLVAAVLDPASPNG